ncbi:hypothetical protein [Neisseria sp. CCUG12390]|uniref:hypothetical protein n=1 Tax=Neisseria sp. CCUG12390 TaxID=3392035 RepID=UPI003A0FF3A3
MARQPYRLCEPASAACRTKYSDGLKSKSAAEAVSDRPQPDRPSESIFQTAFATGKCLSETFQLAGWV